MKTCAAATAAAAVHNPEGHGLLAGWLTHEMFASGQDCKWHVELVCSCYQNSCALIKVGMLASAFCKAMASSASLVGVQVHILPGQIVQVLLAIEGVPACLPVTDCTTVPYRGSYTVVCAGAQSLI